MSCNCGSTTPRTCRCPDINKKPDHLGKATVGFCDICDPCNEAESNVRLCAFVVPTLEEGRYYKNSFIFVEEDDSVYFITEDRSEIPFGSKPHFADDFDPTAAKLKRTIVYDVKNSVMYVFNDDGEYKALALTTTPVADIKAGDGIKIDVNGGVFTVGLNPGEVATTEEFHNLTLLVTNHTRQINETADTVKEHTEQLKGVDVKADKAVDTAMDAQEIATRSSAEAAGASQAASDALSGLNQKQDTLTAGDNISIVDKTISAHDTTYTNFVGATATTDGEYGLVPSPKKEQVGMFLKATGDWADVYPVGSIYWTTANEVPVEGTWEDLGTIQVGDATLHCYERKA